MSNNSDSPPCDYAASVAFMHAVSGVKYYIVVIGWFPCGNNSLSVNYTQPSSRWGTGCQSLLPNDPRCVEVSLCSLKGKKEIQNISLVAWNLYLRSPRDSRSFVLVIVFTAWGHVWTHVWRYEPRFPLLGSEQHICTGKTWKAWVFS